MPNKTKIAITGPESAGKTTLAKLLCNHYQAYYVEDYSRVHFRNLDFNNDCNTIIEIARAQIALEKKALLCAAESIIICDTDLINIKIWMAYYNYEIPQFIEEYIANSKSDLSLLLYPNTTWEADGLRNNQHDRLELFDKFESVLAHQQYNYQVIKKLGTERLDQAVISIDKILKP